MRREVVGITVMDFEKGFSRKLHDVLPVSLEYEKEEMPLCMKYAAFKTTVDDTEWRG